MLFEVAGSVKVEDHGKGRWVVSRERTGIVWCDASSLAIGVCLEIVGDIVEDASWLRKADDSTHINLAELKAVLKGLNLALRWDLTEIQVMTDLATVHSWLDSLLSKTEGSRHTDWERA